MPSFDDYFNFMQIKENFSLKKLNTFGIDVKAKYFAELNSLEEIKEIMQSSYVKEYPFLLLGGGSNILFTKDFEGIVLKINTKGKEITAVDEDFVYLKVQAGENWENFVDYCVMNNWSGIENLALIPGAVGTCPVQNIGAYGVEVKECIEKVEVLNIADGKITEMDNESCQFGYRNSIFKQQAKNKYIILSVSFKLAKKPVLITHYGDILKELEMMMLEPGLATISNAIKNIRRRKLPDPAVTGNAGSFFKNPLVSKEKYEELLKEFPKIRAFPSENNYKLAAGWLIEKSGWKGKSLGNAAVHHKQALVLINKGGATGSEILSLAKAVQHAVLNMFGVELEMEVNLV
ncbi:MAG: UDP-N-acetylmuramate dehydrogenase [Bacteroidetes bacterium]|nr:UDP-N-acetylmuramate dehydrogenase [Bacteroidota bacterium]